MLSPGIENMAQDGMGQGGGPWLCVETVFSTAVTKQLQRLRSSALSVFSGMQVFLTSWLQTSGLPCHHPPASASSEAATSDGSPLTSLPSELRSP